MKLRPIQKCEVRDKSKHRLNRGLSSYKIFAKEIYDTQEIYEAMLQILAEVRTPLSMQL